LERIQSENSDKVEFTFFDSKDDERVQNEIIDNLLQSQTDLFVINLVNTSKNSIVAVIDKIKEKNVPVILLNIAPSEIDSVKSYSKAVVISTNEEQSGTLQGQIIVKAWNSNKEIIDKNKDNYTEYVMLTGYPNILCYNCKNKIFYFSNYDAE
jgi:methyl-galactoside transport system substrate-binding protein